MLTALNNSISAIPGLLAAFEGFWIFIIIVLISAIANWLKKRSEEQEETGWHEVEAPPRHVSPPARRVVPPQQPGRPSPPRPKLSSWEEELRRLLEPEERHAPPPPRPAPVVREVTPRPQRGHEPHPPKIPPVPKPKVVVRTVKRPAPARAPGYSEAELAAARATLDQLAADRPRDVMTAMPSDRRRVFASEIAQARAMFRSPQAVRHAVIASIILDQPKALEGEKVF